jgi:hypothetical protein
MRSDIKRTKLMIEKWSVEETGKQVRIGDNVEVANVRTSGRSRV